MSDENAAITLEVYNDGEAVSLVAPEPQGPETEMTLENAQQLLQVISNDNAMLRMQCQRLQQIVELVLAKGKGYKLVAQDFERNVLNVGTFTIKETLKLRDTVVIRIEPSDAHPAILNALMELMTERKAEWFPDTPRVIVAPPGVEFLTIVPCRAIKEVLDAEAKDIQC